MRLIEHCNKRLVSREQRNKQQFRHAVSDQHSGRSAVESHSWAVQSYQTRGTVYGEYS